MNNGIHLTCPNCKEINNIPESQLVEQLNCNHCKKAIFTNGLITLNDVSFAYVIANTNIPIVVDF